MARYTVLYVDDEPDLLLLGKTFLESTGDFHIDTRESAAEGLLALRAHAYDVVISDFQMPDMDGLAFLKAVRNEFGDKPFILFTGRGREDVVIEAINHGVDFYLQKGGDVKAQFAELAHKVTMAAERKRAVEERIESEKRLSTIFHASPIHQMITEFTTDRIIDINDRFLQDLHLSRADVIGRTTADIGLVPDPEQMAQLKADLSSSGVVRNVPVTVRGSTGKVYTSLTSMTAVRVQGKDLIYTQSVDITPQKKAQQTINALLNAPPDVSLLLDTQGRILAANDAASERFGIPHDDLLGNDVFALAPESSTSQPQDRVAEVIRTRKPCTCTDDRAGRVYENRFYPVLDAGENVTAVAVYSHDATSEVAARHALKESEEKYRLVVENSHDTIYIYRDNRFLFINRQAGELTGYSHEELMQRDIWDFLHPDDRGPLKERALKRFAGGEISSSFQARILRKDGGVREGEFYVDLVEFLGKPAILGIARDITEKKRAEEAIREREEQLRALSDNLPNGMVYQIILNKDGTRRFLHVSAGVMTLHEVTAEDVLRDARVLYDQIVPEDLPGLKEAEEHAFKADLPFSHQVRIRTPSGKERWMLLRSAPRRLKDGSVIWDGIELDITAARQADDELKAAYEQLAASQEELKGQFEALQEGQALLRESEEKYRTLMEQTDDGVFVAQDKKIVFVNRMLAERMGYTPGELTGNPFEQIIAPEDRKMVVERHTTRLAGGQLPADYEFDLLHKDGITRSRVRIRVGTGTYLGKPAVIGTLHDVTEERRQQNALAQSEELLRKMVVSIPDVIVRTDLVGTIHFINDKGLELAGETDPAAMIGRSVFSFFAPECLPLAQENARLMFGRPLGPVEYVFINRNGDRINLEVNGDVLRTPGGEPYGLVFICRDLSERRRAEAALRDSEERYRKFIGLLFDAVVIYQDGTIVLANDAAAQIAGFSQGSELVGRPVISFIHPDYRPVVMERQKRMLESPDVISPLIPEKFLRTDGSVIDVEVMASAIQYNAQPAVQVIFRDISDQVRAREALRKSEEEYRNIIENMQDVFYRTDNEGVITIISEYGARLVGYDSSGEIIGKFRAADFYHDPNERDRLIACLQEKGAVSGYPVTLRDRNGKLHHATASSRLIRNQQGNVTGIEGILHDVTALKEVENALRQANRQITLMTSITRHDIRNQLLALNGWLELSRASVDDPGRMLDIIDREQKIASTIGEQIDFTTLFDDMGAKPPAWQDPAGIIARCHDALPFGNIVLDADLPPVEIFADPLLEKVFYNILDNSLRYAGPALSRITVTARVSGTTLIIAVTDDGCGIALPDKARLFNRGFGENTGLGLFLAREILSITGLSISETGTPGKGARFEISVPPGRFRSSGP